MIFLQSRKKNMSKVITKEDLLDFLRTIEINHPGSDLSRSAEILADDINKDKDGVYSRIFYIYNTLYNPRYVMINDMQLPLIELTGDQYKVLSIMINAMSEDNMLYIDNAVHCKIYGFEKPSKLEENLKVLCDLGYIAEVPHNYLEENFNRLDFVKCSSKRSSKRSVERDGTIYMVAPFISCWNNDRKITLIDIFCDLIGKEKIVRITDKIFERNCMVGGIATSYTLCINYQLPSDKIE